MDAGEYSQASRGPRAWISLALFVLTFVSAVVASAVPALPAGGVDGLRSEPSQLLDGL